jgi:tetratricopeptide (TPR) repeat protein
LLVADSRHPLMDRFPNLQPGKTPGNLGSVNGFGTTVIGRRDFDVETGTYVVTHVVTALFIPIWALGAYRVAEAPSGVWYCLGRVPLSMVARGWNIFLVLAILCSVGGIWWNSHTKSPEYVAGQKLKQADKAAAAGNGGESARLYREVMESNTSHSESARAKFATIIENPPGAPAAAAKVYAVAVELHRENRCPVPDLFEKGKAIAQRHAADAPAAALALLEVIGPFAPDPAAELALRRELLESIFAKSPDDPHAASRLAAAYEETGDREKCEKLLLPFEARLGALDGAAVLGRIYSARGQYDKAHALLAPFVAARLPALHAAEREYSEQTKTVENRLIESLKKGSAPGFDFAKAKKATEAEQDRMVDAYMSDQLKSDATLRAARQKLIAERGVVGAVLDLGLVQLHRAQAMADPAARKVELEAAEKTFLSVRGIAGDSDEYRVSLGQVYYWLGRPADGKKQFDDLIAARNNATAAKLLVARVLREVGENTEARRIAEDAYNKEPSAGLKHQAAHLRAITLIDLDDEVLWLGRCDPNSREVQATLAVARGHKAERDGKDAEAGDQFRQAIAIYAQMPENASTLNNSALAYFSLFSITFDREDFTRGVDKLDRAIALNPTGSIPLLNATPAVADGAARDIVGKSVDLRALKASSWEALPYLRYTPAERAAQGDRCAKHPGFVKARSYAEKLLLLAPKREETYQMLSLLCETANDLEGLKNAATRAEKAELDLSDEIQRYKDSLSGKSDAKRLDETRAHLARTESALTASRPVGGPTFAAAVGRHVRAKYGAWALGLPVDADELVKLAEEVHATPSHGTGSTMETALLFRAHLTLIREDAAYAEIAKRTQRSFGTTLVYYVIATDGPFKAKAVNNPDVKRLATLLEADFRRDPDRMHASEWVLLRGVGSEHAKAVAEKAKANEWSRARLQFNRALSPYASATALTEYWELLLHGKEAEAKKVIAGLAAKGIPVP